MCFKRIVKVSGNHVSFFFSSPSSCVHMGKNKLRHLGGCGFKALLLSRVTAPCHFRLICSFISHECGKKTSAPCSHRSARASPSFLYFVFSVLSPLAFPLSRPRRERRVCLRPVSLRPSPHFFISPDRFRARRLLRPSGT